MPNTLKPAHILSWFVIILSAIASAGGLFITELYRDSDFIRRAWFGSDITTLFIAVPLLAFALRRSMKGSLRAQLLWVGLLGYMLYNYAFYLFGAVFNNFFLVYTAVFSISIYALILALSNHLPVNTFHKRFDTRTPVKVISVFMLIISLSLAIFEFSQVLTAMTLEKQPRVPPIIFALDLSLIIPNMLLAAVLLWQRLSWGYVLTAIMLVKGVTYGISLVISSAAMARFSVAGNWDGLTPFYIFIVVGSLAAAWQLLKNLKSDDISKR